MKSLPALALVLVALGACSSAPVLRYPVPDVADDATIGVGVRSLEVREADLPLYAGLETIAIEGPNGELMTDPNRLWADDPTRAVTQGLADALSSITRAKVAAEPWPLSDLPDARLEVRFSKALASVDGQYRMAGQYYISSPSGNRREVAKPFEVAAPYNPEDVRTIATAQAQAIRELARIIARGGL
ncbi:PqiC family protein [Oceaniglobus roseus]|uniref:PqiC family protein n=1 Tax=Oceaniglobus roseus TaxID=1737570 RepID=UPI000C7EC641|nr:ABC-type transport auxiliary lipoprotein family protein [Kandeliimicrobium roseum]